jgi:hypothetical protein
MGLGPKKLEIELMSSSSCVPLQTTPGIDYKGLLDAVDDMGRLLGAPIQSWRAG